MYAVEKYKFMSISQQKLILTLYNNKKGLTYLDQKIYTNNRSFKIAMRELFNAGICDLKVTKKKSRFVNFYKITIAGMLFVENVLIEFDRCNK